MDEEDRLRQQLIDVLKKLAEVQTELRHRDEQIDKLKSANRNIAATLGRVLNEQHNPIENITARLHKVEVDQKRFHRQLNRQNTRKKVASTLSFGSLPTRGKENHAPSSSSVSANVSGPVESCRSWTNDHDVRFGHPSR